MWRRATNLIRFHSTASMNSATDSESDSASDSESDLDDVKSAMGQESEPSASASMKSATGDSRVGIALAIGGHDGAVSGSRVVKNKWRSPLLSTAMS